MTYLTLIGTALGVAGSYMLGYDISFLAGYSVGVAASYWIFGGKK